MIMTASELRAQAWLEHIRNQLSSGMSVRSWCRENGISEKNFYHWRKKLSDVAFVEFGDFGLLTSDEVLQLLDPVHGFFPVITIDLELFFLVAEPENLISDGIVWL